MNKKLIIGAIHFSPMPGYTDYPGHDVALKNALADLAAFEVGGVDAVIIENNYDIPHKERISVECLDEMIRLGTEIKNRTKLLIGVSVLWNDYRSALVIAKKIGADFIRVPVFVDTVETEYGIMHPKAREVMRTREEISCQNIKIFADIQVKHAKMLSNYTIEESARLAIEHGAEALIVTGKWTGDSPDIEDLKKVKIVSGQVPVICGSGISKENVREMLEIADGAIVSTSLKEKTNESHQQNVKPYSARISQKKVYEFVAKVKFV